MTNWLNNRTAVIRLAMNTVVRTTGMKPSIRGTGGVNGATTPQATN